ncbi:hypothetical protein C1645_818167 [Glomus cerebriforme]|uniref:Uncharacterized protein n=1 Tax=Glomus cerebriforme TaxID=658196 RepID=A0A397T7X3_9GLOM|nr:hypothetical protein C1645_818167 [Glomus cerebriforme]
MKWDKERSDKSSEIYSQIKECDKISREKFKNKFIEDKCKNIQLHPQAIYTSRFLNFRNFPEQIYQIYHPFSLVQNLPNPNLNEIDQDSENNVEE